MKLMEPLAPPGRYDSADPFGNIGGRQYPHTGSDWNGVPAGTAAKAIGTGVVVNKQWHSGNGNTVTVKLPDGHYYAYLHLNAEAPVAVGQTVTIGQVIGYVGNTGTNSQGAHLHITVSDSPSAYAGLGNKIDPWAFIQAHKNDTDPTTPGGSARITILEDGMFIRNSDSVNTGYVPAGWSFQMAPDGKLQPLSSQQTQLAIASGATIFNWAGRDIYNHSVKSGMWEFTGPISGADPGSLTGYLLFGNGVKALPSAAYPTNRVYV
ncbi:M23 family metallopeptidase [Leifsonia aquatica]|uniref:M23 family metallopeptidase n=1 Tax=Leifsonia aquatica TaxID=144185 RepID=UPI00046A5569|nr:M23 family metallopeptidase [Leifsonia aquatica]